MSKKPILYTSLSTPEKVDFFINCQKLLINNHSQSEFLLTKENLEEKKYYALKFINNYKGYSYSSENICLLFNKVFLKDPRNPQRELRDNIFKTPDENYNCVLIDFVVFRKLIDCLSFIKQEYEPRMEFVLFVKNNEVKLYRTDKLVEKLNSPLTSILASF